MKLDWVLLKENWGAFLMVFAVWSLYVYLTFAGPINEQSRQIFSLSILQLRLVQLSVALPYLFIWIFIAYGILQLDRFRKIEEGKIKSAFTYITAGITILGTSTILSALIGSVRTFFRNSGPEDLYRNLTIATNYVNIILPLISFVLLLYGIYRVSGGTKIFSRENITLVIILLILIGGLYIPLVFTNPSRNFPQNSSDTATYFLSDTMIIGTILIPLFLTWAAALFSVLSLNDVKIVRDAGLEKNGIRNLMFGIWFIIVSSMLLQSLLSLGGTRLIALGLGLILLLIYQFLVLQGVGYLYIASAARKFVSSRLSPQ